MRVRTKRIACAVFCLLLVACGVFFFACGKEAPPPYAEGEDPLPVRPTVDTLVDASADKLPLPDESESSEADVIPKEEPGVQPPVEVITYETKETKLPYESIEIPTAELTEGETVVVTKGVHGVKKTTYKIVLLDGEEISRTVMKETTEAPINEKILVGTRPKTAPTGTFRVPLAGTVRVTSYFGWRTLRGERDYHYGVDFACAVGTAVYAADGGTVVFAGKLGGISASYGNLIILAHGDTYRSYYAHLSRFSVKTGDAVAKGQVIGYSGVTGNVTGPHLHFEIRKNGKLQDPLAYLSL